MTQSHPYDALWKVNFLAMQNAECYKSVFCQFLNYNFTSCLEQEIFNCRGEKNSFLPFVETKIAKRKFFQTFLGNVKDTAV